MKAQTPREKLEREREQAMREAEIMGAHAIARAYPELTYGEALRHACVKLRKQRKQETE